MPTVRAAGNQTILAYVRSAAETAQVCALVCTGALVLAAAGLLEGRPATTHWAYWRLLEKLGARYVPEQRWVEDGKFITSAGVSARIDMALHLVERLTNESTARMVQLGIEYDPKPPTRHPVEHRGPGHLRAGHRPAAAGHPGRQARAAAPTDRLTRHAITGMAPQAARRAACRRQASVQAGTYMQQPSDSGGE